MWLEICTDDKEDWKRALKICARAFLRTPWFSNSALDHTASTEFADSYYNYLYETQMSDDRAALACVKTKKSDGSVAIAYVAVWVWNRPTPTLGNISAMQRASTQMTNVNLRADIWEEKAVHDKIRAATKSLNISSFYGLTDATAPEFMKRGIGKKYSVRAKNMLYSDAIRRGKLDKLKPCLIYGIVDDPRLARVTRGQQREIAHLHETVDSVCLRSEDLKSDELCDGCIIVYATIFNGFGKAEDEKLFRRISTFFENNLMRFH